jgi:WD40 repeat protein
MPDRFTYDVFLSHNSRDKARVRKLAEKLRASGLSVWFDEWQIIPGDDIYLAIERGLEAARVQVLCLSPTALGSEWVQLERSTVLFRDPTNKGRRFVPLLLQNCTLPDVLRRYKYVDYRQPTPRAFEELVAACRKDIETYIEAAQLAQHPEPKIGSPPPRHKPTNENSQDPNMPLAVHEIGLTGSDVLFDCVNSVAVSPDGSWAASGSDDMTVKIWNLETGEYRATLIGHTGEVNCVAIRPDGKRIVSASSDKSVRVWDTCSGKEVAKLMGHQFGVTSVVSLADNARALSSSPGEKALRLWELAAGKCLKIIFFDGHADYVNCSAANSAGTQALTGHRNGMVLQWDIETGRLLRTYRGHLSMVTSVRFTPDGRYVISGSEDKTLKVWEVAGGACVGTLEGHLSSIGSVAISPDGSLIASTGFDDGTVRLWDRKLGVCLQVIGSEDTLSPFSVSFSPDGSRLLVGTSFSCIDVYRLTGRPIAPTAEHSCRYVNAKVVLLGEGSVGKTSLAHRLIEDQYVVKDRTHGMNVWTLELTETCDHTSPDNSSTKNFSSATTSQTLTNLVKRSETTLLDREALLWDLAGQEDYRLIHRLFIDETALALLLINPQKDDPFAEAGDWLKALDTATQNHDAKRAAARLLIFSQNDVGGMKIGNAKIERFLQEHRFSASLVTSAKTGENCSDQANAGQPSQLKQLIAASIPWDQLPWTATPRLLAELKNAVMQMRATADIRLLRFAELAQRLEQSLPGVQFGESEVRTAVTLLANHGLARPLKFGDLVLLQPELLNGYAGAMIRAARAHRDEIGSVLEAEIYDPKFDFTGVDRLLRPDEELLLRAMVQTFLDHSLCIAEETPHGRQLVFPSQYRREKDIPWQPDVFISYTFGGEWQTIWTTLVVRLWCSNVFEHRELWRNAAEFASSRGNLLGLKIDNRQGEGEATISLFFDIKTPDELKMILIEYVHQHLARYGCNVKRDRRYVCVECGKSVTDLEAVRKRFAAGKDFITCQACDGRVQLIDFIEQRLKTDPIALKILEMEETATRQLDEQALEQILIGHVQAITGEANQIFRELTKFDYGIDGEIEFKDNKGQPSGQKIYVQLKSGNSYLRTRKSDGREIFDVKNERHLQYWLSQPVDVYLVFCQTDGQHDNPIIRWMNVTRYLKNPNTQSSRQIVFNGEKLDMHAVWRLRDQIFPPRALTDK